MGVNGGMSARMYGVTIDVPEELVEKLVARGKKPSLILSTVVQRMVSEVEVDGLIDYAGGRDVHVEGEADCVGISPADTSSATSAWTYEIFRQYMANLVNLAEKRASVGDLVSLLAAYHDVSSRPTSEELREARGFGSGQKWYEELRTAKARLTIAAKHLGLPSFFMRAYGSGIKRRHPMDETVYGFLSRWGSEYLVTIDEYRQLATPRSID